MREAQSALRSTRRLPERVYAEAAQPKVRGLETRPLTQIALTVREIARSQGEHDLVVDSVERVLGQPLPGLEIGIPDRPTRVRLAGRVGKHLHRRHAGRAA